MDISYDLYYRMQRIRSVEEEIAKRYSEEKMRCPVHLSIGQEAISAGFSLAIDKKDFAVSTHRGHAHYLGKGGSLKSMIAEIYGKKTVYLFDYYDNKELTKDVGIVNKKSNFIKENFFHLDHSKLKIYKVDVNEGDSLTIPPWWWHAVKGYGVSFTITKTYCRSNLEYLTSLSYR